MRMNGAITSRTFVIRWAKISSGSVWPKSYNTLGRSVRARRNGAKVHAGRLKIARGFDAAALTARRGDESAGSVP
jgi:hypothetical protein